MPKLRNAVNIIPQFKKMKRRRDCFSRVDTPMHDKWCILIHDQNRVCLQQLKAQKLVWLISCSCWYYLHIPAHGLRCIPLWGLLLLNLSGVYRLYGFGIQTLCLAVKTCNNCDCQVVRWRHVLIQSTNPSICGWFAANHLLETDCSSLCRGPVMMHGCNSASAKTKSTSISKASHIQCFRVGNNSKRILASVPVSWCRIELPWKKIWRCSWEQVMRLEVWNSQWFACFISG